MDNNMGKSKNTLWIVIVAIIIIGLGIWMYGRPKAAVAPVADTTTTEVDGTEDTTGTPATSGTPAVSMSYKQALVAYKDKRIQLSTTTVSTGEVCNAIPRNVTYKNGTTIMIDNRTPSARTFKLGDTYSIKAYGFRLVKLSSAKLPATWLLDCGKQQNVATILLQ